MQKESKKESKHEKISCTPTKCQMSTHLAFFLFIYIQKTFHTTKSIKTKIICKKVTLG